MGCRDGINQTHTLHTLKVRYCLYMLLSYFYTPCAQIIWSLWYLLQPLVAWKNPCDCLQPSSSSFPRHQFVCNPLPLGIPFLFSPSLNRNSASHVVVAGKSSCSLLILSPHCSSHHASFLMYSLPTPLLTSSTSVFLHQLHPFLRSLFVSVTSVPSFQIGSPPLVYYFALYLSRHAASTPVSYLCPALPPTWIGGIVSLKAAFSPVQTIQKPKKEKELSD